MTGALEDLSIAAGYWYMATPYSKSPLGLDGACEAACLLAGACFRRGLHVFSPIAHNHSIAVACDIDPRDNLWMNADRPMFEAAHGLLVMAMDGWRDSVGIKEEIEWAHELKKPRFLIDPVTLTWQVFP